MKMGKKETPPVKKSLRVIIVEGEDRCRSYEDKIRRQSSGSFFGPDDQKYEEMVLHVASHELSEVILGIAKHLVKEEAEKIRLGGIITGYKYALDKVMKS